MHKVSIILTVPLKGNYVNLLDYDIHRILNGVAEGPRDFVTGKSNPLESNLDLTDASCVY